MTTNETKIAILETNNSHIIQTLERIENKLESLDMRMWSMMLGLVACFGATLISIVAKALEWF